MNIPTATYRLQLRNGMNFERAEKLVPYLHDLGISHLYLSPIMSAVAGSTHGYDVTDCNQIDETLGGRRGFDRLCEALQRADLGLIIDIVPNHMAASTENAWWADVLAHGSASRYARHFDIDWSERLTLPILGKPFEDAIADGELDVRMDTKTGQPSLFYFDTALPLDPKSTGALSLPLDGDGIRKLHDAQHWQLTFWKTAARHLSYRRFFEVTGLVGLRVEDVEVFDDAHQLVFELVRSGQVQGLRLDHIDGLADPATYLTKLRHAVGPEIFIVVEKILGHGETLPAEWPVEGTTGYEFITALSNLFVDRGGWEAMRSLYSKRKLHREQHGDELRAAKALMVDENFAGEVNTLVKHVLRARPDFDKKDVADTIRELLIAFPVYRTYGADGVLNERDSSILQGATDMAADRVYCSKPLTWLQATLQDGSLPMLRQRFQQLSGPIMAKAVEDTLFYRSNAMLALNEVGGEPQAAPEDVQGFHRLMQERLRTQPHGLSATSTHDTKRGEDARARLYALSEAPASWSAALDRWTQLNHPYVTADGDRVVPDAALEWMLYQALAGCWPEEEAETDLSDRFLAYAEKAVREAKLGTSWNEPDARYEAAVRDYAAAMTSPENEEFRRHFEDAMQAIIGAGHVNSLAQTLIKLTAPGIPDIYQGSERMDLSLVDPDNRQLLDLRIAAEADADVTLGGRQQFALLKQHVIRLVLGMRKTRARLFSRGHYLPLFARGKRSAHVVAFARHDDQGHYAITVAARLMYGRLEAGTLETSPDFWEDTVIDLPRELSGARYELFSHAELQGNEINLSAHLASLPIALFVSR
ncbi:malto-oligosyltrehalose synthase [Rhizobium sp. S152]|uniref:malto-oligosyltrehalose synthase n=1 Tax=Rhizobium sp. S152 TaxID=3055038 RepID=UPI0025A94560|nr:malto-oligosyltrehalose synthase [Rhizobium sp. S152]MDM9625393.1 malto-oligosyltrehalose synthase [Rhizobium sp. S152]